MEIVQTRKLNKGVLYVIGNVTQEMFIAYIFVWLAMAWFSRAWFGNMLIQFAVPAPIILFVVHPITVAVSDLAVVQQAVLALQFSLKADRYVLQNDSMPLPAVIPNSAMKLKRSTRN